MTLDKLWAPWRINYIKNKRKKGCIFCQALKSKKNNHIIFKTKHCLTILNIFPYNNGHLMVVPKRHIKDITQLKKEEVLDLFSAIGKSKKILDKVLKPNGYNVGINLSRASGAGITGHIHIHIVPRWMGDTNFMPAVFNTKVVSQSLDELSRQLRNALPKIS